MKLRVALLLVFALALSACAPGDIDLVLDEFPSQDLSQSDDPGERTAGESAIEILTIREAEDNLERGVAERDFDAVARARNLRPSDPKYDAYQLALLAGEDIHADGTDPGLVGQRGFDAAQGLGAKLAATRPDLSAEERGRISNEMYIDAMLDVIHFSPASPARDRTIEVYCALINQRYPQLWTDRFPADVAFFLALQDFSVCPG